MKKVLLVVLAAGLAASAAPPSKLSQEMATADPQAMVRVVVRWASAPDDSKDRKVLSRGGMVHYRFRAVPMGVYTLSGSAVRDLANDPDVAYISVDRPIFPKLDLTAAAVNASTLWNAGWTGSGIGVAVIDSGINSDPNLGPGRKVVFSYDFTNANNAAAAASFLSTLGTGTSGPTAAAPGPGPAPAPPAPPAPGPAPAAPAPPALGGLLGLDRKSVV